MASRRHHPLPLDSHRYNGRFQKCKIGRANLLNRQSKILSRYELRTQQGLLQQPASATEAYAEPLLPS